MGEVHRVPAPPPDPQQECLQHLLTAAIHLRHAKQIAEGLKPLTLEKVYWKSSDALTIVVQTISDMDDALALEVTS